MAKTTKPRTTPAAANESISIAPEITVAKGTMLLKLTGINKSFPGVKALKDVSLEVVAGEVHALVGENGAGKSTLMAVASGALVAEEGTIEIGGEPLLPGSPREARNVLAARHYTRQVVVFLRQM